MYEMFSLSTSLHHLLLLPLQLNNNNTAHSLTHSSFALTFTSTTSLSLTHSLTNLQTTLSFLPTLPSHKQTLLSQCWPNFSDSP